VGTWRRFSITIGAALAVACSGSDTTSDVESDPAFDPILKQQALDACAADGWGRTWEGPDMPVEEARLAGGGLIVGDFDGNDVHDVVLLGENASVIWWNGNESEPRARWDDAVGGSTADYDGDGDLDLIVTRGTFSAALVQNNDGRFEDVTTSSGIDTSGSRIVSATWGDIDRDGDLDLFLGGYGDKVAEAFDEATVFPPASLSRLYLQRDDHTFEDASWLLPAAVQEAYTFQGAMIDLDGDGWVELFVVNDFGWYRPSVLLSWEDGALVDRSAETGLGWDGAGMGFDIGDIDGDGHWDMVSTSYQDLPLYQGFDGFWARQDAVWGVPVDPLERVFGWGTRLADLDLDGDLDLPVGWGHWVAYRNHVDQPDSLLMWNGTAFEDKSVEHGFDSVAATRGLQVADLNRDGAPDVLRHQVGGGLRVDGVPCSGNGFVVELRDVAPNTRGIGAVVEVVVGERVRRRAVTAGSTSMFSGEPPEVYFGLGDAQQVDELRIVWPGRQVQTLTNLPSHHKYIIQREETAQ